jgi:hypothetical protein
MQTLRQENRSKEFCLCCAQNRFGFSFLKPFQFSLSCSIIYYRVEATLRWRIATPALLRTYPAVLNYFFTKQD